MQKSSNTLAVSTENEISFYSTTAAVPIFSHRLPSSNSPSTSILGAISWSNNGGRLATVENGVVKIWDKEGVEYGSVSLDKPAISALFHTRQPLIFISSGSSVALHPHPTSATLTDPIHFLGHPASGTITSFSVNVDSSLLASTTLSSLLIHNLSSNPATKFTLTSRPTASYSLLKFHPIRKTLLAAGTSSGILHFFDTTKPSAPLRSITIASGSAITNLIFSPIGNPLLVVGNQNGLISLVDTNSMKVVSTIESGAELEKGHLALGGDGRNVVVAGKRRIRTIDLKSGKKGGVVELDSRIRSLAYQPPPPKVAKAPTADSKGSAVLAETINRMRASHHSLKKIPDLSPPVEEMFSPIGSRTGNELDLEDLPTRDQLAESISKEARTSTLRSNSHSLDLLRQSLSEVQISDSDPDDLGATPIPLRTQRVSSKPPIARLTSNSASLSQSTSLKLRDHTEPLTHTRSHSISLSTPSASFDLNDEESLKLPTPTLPTPAPRVRSATPEASPSADAEEKKVIEERKKSRNGGEKENSPEKKVGFAGYGRERSKKGKRKVTPRFAPIEVEQVYEEPAMVKSDKNEEPSAVVLNAESDSLEEMVRVIVGESLQKTNSDIKNLHVEMLRQTFQQRVEMKAMLESYLGGELKNLREENLLLREENRRLRRSRT